MQAGLGIFNEGVGKEKWIGGGDKGNKMREVGWGE